jgi:hypothetical protein
VGNGGRVLKVQGDRPISLDSGTRHNLRAVSVNPMDGTALIVGNVGTVLLLDGERFRKITVPTFENLRTVAWNHDGYVALLAGNNGTLFKFSRGRAVIVDAGRANLRDISWRPKSSSALISSNCFAEEFIPSPNLFSYDADANILGAVNEGRVDLIGVDWKQTGESALVVGMMSFGIPDSLEVTMERPFHPSRSRTTTYTQSQWPGSLRPISRQL